MGETYKNNYYYTSDYKVGEDCSIYSNYSSNSYCGGMSVVLQNDELVGNMRIYCTSEGNAQLCDEIVKLMSVNLLSSENLNQNMSNAGISYYYPSNWSFRNGREGIGLYPKDDSNYLTGETEILTIFSEESSLSAKEWAMSYDGSGYAVEKEMKINGYDTYYVENKSDNYYTILYTLSDGNSISHVVFRKWLTQDNSYIDNSEYADTVQSIVESIKFN
jgi:hypothetical protein